MGELKWVILYLIAIVVTAGFGVVFAVIFPAKSQGEATSKAVEGIARQPEAAGKIFMPLVVGLALMEALALYALLVSLILLFMFGGPAAEALLKQIVPKVFG